MVVLNIIDLMAGLNLVLILGSFFLATGIILSLREGEYILAKGWKYILPAVLVFAVIKVYDFFTEYALYSSSRVVREGLLLGFSSLLFMGLLIQYMAIKEVISKRG